MIRIFDAGTLTPELVAALDDPAPKHIWHDRDKITIYTGADIPPEAILPETNADA